MNKFVKGAKNLAFALSFVIVAACGRGKEIEDLKKQVEACSKKVSDVDKKADDLNSEIKGCVSTADLENVKNRVVALGKDADSLKGVFEKGDLEKISILFGDVVGGVVDCSKYKISVGKMDETVGKIAVKIENGDTEVYDDIFNGKVFGKGDQFDRKLRYLGAIVVGKGSVDYHSDNVFKLASATKKLQLGACLDVSSLFVEICRLLNVLGVKADQCGFDKLFVEKKVFGETSSNFDFSCGTLVSGLNAFAGEKVCQVKEVGASNGSQKVVVLLKDVFGGKKGDEIGVKNA